jgi:hypothetical protein
MVVLKTGSSEKMKMNAQLILVRGFMGLLLSLPASSALAKSTHPVHKIAPHFEYYRYTSTVATPPKLTSAKSYRRLSSASFSDNDLKEDFKAFRTRFLQVKTADQLGALLQEGDTNYDSYSPELKYFVAQAVLLVPYRGIFYRAQKLFDQSKSVHSIVVSSIRGSAASMNIYLPSDAWKAGFDFISVPDDANSKQYTQMSELQDFFASTVPGIKKSIERITALLTSGEGMPFVWDNQLAFGADSYADGLPLDRYRANGVPEVSATLAAQYGSVQAIDTFCAYNVDDILNVAEALGHQIGLNGFDFLAEVGIGELGVSDSDRSKVFVKYSAFLTLRADRDPAITDDPGLGKRMMSDAFINLRSSVKYVDAGWKNLMGTDSNQPVINDYAIFDSRRFQADSRTIQLRLDTINAAVNGTPPTMLRSVITGGNVSVDLPSLFNNPPQDLKAFLPTGFDNSENYSSYESTSGKKYKYRNYFHGRSTSWNTAAWAPYFPSAQGQGADYPSKIAQILKETWGGDLFAPIVDSALR